MHRRAALWVCAGAGVWIRLCARILRGADSWCGDRVWGWGVLLAGEVRGLPRLPQFEPPRRRRGAMHEGANWIMSCRRALLVF
jgi:hypothetical protein